MRILFLSFPYASTQGGGERYTEQVVEGLKRAGHESALAASSEALLTTFKKRGWRSYSAWCGVEPVTPFSAALFPLTIIVFTPFLLLLLAWFRFAHGMKAVVCLSFTEKLLATPIARMFGMRVVWTEHLVAGRSLRLNPYRGWYVACARWADVVTVSEAAAKALVEVGVPRGSIRVIFPGVKPVETVIPPPGGNIIGVISRLSREKNVSLALRAFALVQKELPEAKLEVFGDGPERTMLVRLAAELGIAGATTFHGFVERIRGAGRFDVLAVPSLKESFGMAALEAMADGIPVVAARVGGLPEVVVHGKTGLLVPSENPRAMADALLELLRDPGLAARLGAAGRERATSMFAEDNMQNAWIELFSSP
ncbi:MAG: glycosyltransferase family 4 protein [Patescibacteria group bacterium]|nr:MAG: glycosyltransferase family 4 protein [Patescibacteria group bacterium]